MEFDITFVDNPLAQSQAPATKNRENPSGGSAAAGGMNLHARVTAVAAVYLLGRRQLGWLKELEVDIPTEIWCETNGPGDDLRFVLSNNLVLEAQVKKGLKRGDELWTALDSLAHGIAGGSIAYGVLIIDIDASNTIRRGLARGIVRLGEGRVDSLDEITSELKSRLEIAGLPTQTVCGKLRIVVVHCADQDDATEQAAKSELLRLCVSERDADSAWRAIQLSAHGSIERRGRWDAGTLLGILTTAHVKLHGALDERPPAVVSGWIWEHLDAVSPYRGYIQSFRQHYLASESIVAQPFGGREPECRRLDAWLSDTTAPSRFLICAPTARGKSALLVQWTERLESDATWAVVFVPISLRFGTDRPAVFYGLIAMQLAHVLQRKLVPPPVEVDAYYQGICAALLIDAAKASRYVLIVVDGLDEAQGAGFNPTVFPASLPPNIKILISAREQAGDKGPEGWLRRLDWQGGTRVVTEHLSILDREAVAPILESVGIAKEAVSAALISRLMELSAGEPLLLGLYAEDLGEVANIGGPIGVEVLDGLLSGFAAYFSRAFDALSLNDGSRDQEAVAMTLAVLAIARGPIENTHLTDLVCRLCDLPRPVVSDRFINPLKRFIAGDGRIEYGYVLNHPKLGEYLREERFDSTTLQQVEDVFLEWGRGTAKRLSVDPSVSVPTYILRHHVSHLRHAGCTSLDDIETLLTEGWRQAWFRHDKDYAGYADSLLTASQLIRPFNSYDEEANRALRLRIKIALMVSSVKSQGINVPSELLDMALREQLFTLRQAINIADLQLPENRTGYLLGLASNLPSAILEQLLSDILQTGDIIVRNSQLARLAPHLPGPRKGEVVNQVMNWLCADGDLQHKLGVVAVFAPCLDDAQLDKVFAAVMSNILPSQDFRAAIVSLAPAIDILRERNRNELAERLIERCANWLNNVPDLFLAVQCLEALAPRVTSGRLIGYIAQLTLQAKALQASYANQFVAPWDMLAQYRHAERVRTLATLATLELNEQPAETCKASLAKLLMPLLVPDYWHVNVLVNIVSLIRPDVRQDIVALVYPFVLHLPSANNRTHALVKLANAATLPLRRAIIEQALVDARRIEDDYSIGRALVALFSTLSLTEKEQQLGKISGDIMKARYVLHHGELMLQLSSYLPTGAEYAEMGIQAILSSEDFGNSTSKLLVEFKVLPPSRREEVFQLCWERIVARPDMLSGIQLGMAALCATEFWTVEKFKIAREVLAQIRPDVRRSGLADLVAVAIRFGDRNFVDEVLNEIAAPVDYDDGLPYLVRALKSLQVEGLHRDILRKCWFRSIDSKSPPVVGLIDGFKILDNEDKVLAWPKLTARVRETPGMGQLLAQLSLITDDPIERRKLLDEALTFCANERAEARVPVAAQIAAACKTEEERWRALDLMTAAPAVSRDAILSALKLAAPLLTEIGTTSLTLALMEDIRQSAVWWP